MVNAIVYWAHLPSQTDIKTSGYVGVTRQTLTTRWAQHQSDARKRSKLYFHNALRKYQDEMLVEVFFEGDEELCYLVEWGLRPKREIGYNIAIGGECPTIGATFSQEYRDNVSKRVKGTKHSIESRLARSESMKGAFAWSNRGANKGRWSLCKELYTYFKENPSNGYLKMASDFGHNKQAFLTIYKKLKAGWNPNTDQDYLNWLSEYTKQQKDSSEITPVI